MKTLILNGSPRINGDTNSLIKELVGNAIGEYMVINAYRCHISPCIDCRYCWDNRGSCAIKDEMQDVYEYIQQQKDKLTDNNGSVFALSSQLAAFCGTINRSK